jgi:excisionase family DNA binding protein
MGRKKKDSTKVLDFGVRYLDVAEAAELLRVKVSTIYSWIHKQEIMDFPVRHHGRKPVFLLDDLKKWSDTRSRK